MKKVGIVIIIVGFLLTVITAFTYFTREKVVDIGKVKISRDKPHHLNWSPLVGIGIMGIGGLALLVPGRKP